MANPVATLTELIAQLSDPAIGAQFAKGFAARYFAPALGALPKSEVDQLDFDSLVEIGLIDPDGAIFAIARALNVTPAKARGLLFQHQLRQPLDAAALNAQILKAIGNARFSVDDKRLSFGIESPLVRAAVQARMKQVGIFSDISLSGEILRVPLDQVGDFLAAFLTDEDVDRIAKALKKEGKLPKGWFIDHLNKLGARRPVKPERPRSRPGCRPCSGGSEPSPPPTASPLLLPSQRCWPRSNARGTGGCPRTRISSRTG